MITDEIRAVLKRRAETEDEWDYGVEKCWEEEVEILTRNVKDTIWFFENECTADELSWISEVFDEIFEKTPDIELYYCIRNTCTKYPEECEKYYIFQQLDDWEEAILFISSQERV